MWQYSFARRLMRCFSLCEKIRIKVLLFDAHGCEDDARFYADGAPTIEKPFSKD